MLNVPRLNRFGRRLAVVLAADALLLGACDDEPARAPATRVEGAAPVARPARTTGLDSLLLAAAYDSAARLPRLRSLLVARDGELLAERYFHGARPSRPANIKSASKSIISALVGIAIAEGKLAGVDQRVAPFFPRELGPGADSLERSITVGDLLSMRAGLEPTSFGNYGAWVSSRDWVRYVLKRPMVDRPGGRMLYSTGNTHLLSAILTRATGMSTYAYARRRLFGPIGVELRAWPTDPQGIYFGGNEMRLTPRDMLRFGELYRNAGAYEGRQVVPRRWVEESWQPRTTSPFNGYAYGYGWWGRRSGGHDVYFAWGYGGQFIFVVPGLALTVVATSDPDLPRDGAHLRALHRLLDDWIVPAAEKGAVGRAVVPRGR